MAFLVYETCIIFIGKIWKKVFPPHNLNGLGRLLNALQIQRIHVLRFLNYFASVECKELSHFLTFFWYFHLYFIGNQLFHQVMASFNMPFFSTTCILFPQEKNNKNPSKIICDYLITNWLSRLRPSELSKFWKWFWIFNMVTETHNIKYHCLAHF